jgi:ribosomal protein S18 acetylase RimI-like enzyme
LDSLHELLAESERLGYGFIRRLVDDWTSGNNRFDRPGEGLYSATLASRIVGVCGLNVDPYAADSRTGRVRHLCVLSEHRRRGIGGQLVRQVIGAAQGSFAWLRLRTGDESAARFYESLGFRACHGDEFCTHVLDLRQAD